MANLATKLAAVVAVLAVLLYFGKVWIVYMIVEPLLDLASDTGLVPFDVAETISPSRERNPFAGEEERPEEMRR